MENQLQNQSITAVLVPENRRMNFLPSYFGPTAFIHGENAVYAFLERLSPDYTGGMWNFYEVSNGGFYLAPESDSTFTIKVEGNGYSGQVSADAAGVIATIFAVGYMAAKITDPNEQGPLVEHYHRLLEFADSHSEGGAIFQAID